jgi:hypothetical protein
MGCLLFDDPAFCRQTAALLKGYCGRAIEFIGGVDVSGTF